MGTLFSIALIGGRVPPIVGVLLLLNILAFAIFLRLIWESYWRSLRVRYATAEDRDRWKALVDEMLVQGSVGRLTVSVKSGVTTGIGTAFVWKDGLWTAAHALRASGRRPQCVVCYTPFSWMQPRKVRSHPPLKIFGRQFFCFPDRDVALTPAKGQEGCPIAATFAELDASVNAQAPVSTFWFDAQRRVLWVGSGVLAGVCEFAEGTFLYYRQPAAGKTRPGSSGSPAIVVTPQGAYRLVGIHVRANDDFGYVEPVLTPP